MSSLACTRGCYGATAPPSPPWPRMRGPVAVCGADRSPLPWLRGGGEYHPRQLGLMARRFFILTIAVFAVLSVGTAQARVPAGFVGMTAEELVGKDTSQAYIDQALAGQRSAGVRLLRQTFRWNYIESAPSALHPYPNYDWRLHDRLVLSAARHGIPVMPVLFDPPDFYSAKRPGTPSPPPPLNPGTMALFADAAVA